MKERESVEPIQITDGGTDTGSNRLDMLRAEQIFIRWASWNIRADDALLERVADFALRASVIFAAKLQREVSQGAPMKFRKKPVVIDAVQWFPGVVIEGVVESPVLEPTLYGPTGQYGQIKTLEGWMTCSPGDWIITGVAGEKYPCKPEIFAATYETVGE